MFGASGISVAIGCSIRLLRRPRSSSWRRLAGAAHAAEIGWRRVCGRLRGLRFSRWRMTRSCWPPALGRRSRRRRRRRRLPPGSAGPRLGSQGVAANSAAMAPKHADAGRPTPSTRAPIPGRLRRDRRRRKRSRLARAVGRLSRLADRPVIGRRSRGRKKVAPSKPALRPASSGQLETPPRNRPDVRKRRRRPRSRAPPPASAGDVGLPSYSLRPTRPIRAPRVARQPVTLGAASGRRP